MIKDRIRHFIELGTREHHDHKQNQSIRLINKICYFVILVTTPYMLLTLYFNSILATLIQLGAIMALGLTVFINSRQFFNLARTLTLLIGNLHIFIMALILGHESGIYFYFSAAIIAPLFFYTSNEMKYLAFFPILTTVLALLVQFLGSSIEPIADIPVMLQVSFYYFSVFGAVITTFFFVLYFYNESNRSEQSLKAVNKKLLELSETDPLTQLPNRRAFARHLEREWEKGILNRTPIAVIMLDLDYFKMFNDHYGHQKGDHSLAKIARIISQGTRQFLDFPARYGGEEFIILLSNIDPDSAHASAERIRKALHESAIPHQSSSERGLLTCSLGVACCVPDNDSDAESLIRKADKALYRAKKNGRNRVELSSLISLNAVN